MGFYSPGTAVGLAGHELFFYTGGTFFMHYYQQTRGRPPVETGSGRLCDPFFCSLCWCEYQPRACAWHEGEGRRDGRSTRSYVVCFSLTFWEFIPFLFQLLYFFFHDSCVRAGEVVWWWWLETTNRGERQQVAALRRVLVDLVTRPLAKK